MLLLNCFLDNVKKRFNVTFEDDDKNDAKEYDYLVRSGQKPPKLTVSKLKLICKSKGLKVSGKKKDLIDRINEKDISETMSKLEKKFGIPKHSLSDILNSIQHSKHTKIHPKKTSYLIDCKHDVPKSPYDSLKVSDLKTMCKDKGLKTTGTKKSLITRLNTFNKRSSGVLNKLCTTDSVVIKRNQFGNYIHGPSQLVFDKITKKVLGRQDESGEIITLCKKDVLLCKQYSFEFDLPENLNSPEDMLDDTHIVQNDIFDLNTIEEDDEYLDSDIDSD